MENIFIILFGLSMLYIAATSRMSAQIHVITAQGWLLFFICIAGFVKTPWFNCESLFNTETFNENIPHFISIAVILAETLVIKAVVIPLFLKKIIRNTHAHRDTEANIPHFYSLFIASIILFLGFITAGIDLPQFKMVSPVYFGISMSVIIISLWLITVKHNILSNIISFITMENGIFLLSISVAKEMPVIISLGVLLDIFIAVFILGILVKEINNKFADLEVSHLSDLKDYEYND